MNISAKCAWALVLALAGGAPLAAPIDRQALVVRHNPQLAAIDPWAPLSVGNGQFCFTADVTGLQTFPEHYRARGIALETQARWSWHEDPNPDNYKLSDANRDYTAHGRTVGYPTQATSPAGLWLRANPHAWPLGQLACGAAMVRRWRWPISAMSIRSSICGGVC
ncbi:hypothetical protein [Duganella sp. P38]|uniref:hypothetical protein n=1 Tax=Duganella sp. P38 TaxID=3423949 RepID=UPI003D7BB201